MIIFLKETKTKVIVNYWKRIKLVIHTGKLRSAHVSIWPKSFQKTRKFKVRVVKGRKR